MGKVGQAAEGPRDIAQKPQNDQDNIYADGHQAHDPQAGIAARNAPDSQQRNGDRRQSGDKELDLQISKHVLTSCFYYLFPRKSIQRGAAFFV